MPIPKLLVTAALMAAQVAIGAARKIEGPRLDSLDVSTSEYGTPIPRFWGKRRFEVPIIWAEKLREKKKTSKTKGGKYTEYRYFGTWAVAIADHEIDAVTRIWMDRRLVYQKVGTGPTSVAHLLGLGDSSVTPIMDGGLFGSSKLTTGRNMRIYLGTETQDPDPRMEAWCEDRYGANSCPAYRGVSYIVFQDIPLEKFGNRIPQISVEAVSDKTDQFLYETVTTGDTSLSNFSFGGGYVVHWRTSGRTEWWDAATRTNLGSSPSAGYASGSVASIAISDDGIAHFVGVELTGGSPKYLTAVSPLSPPVKTLTDSPTALFEITRVYGTGADTKIYTAYDDTAGYLLGAYHVAHSLRARDFCRDANGDVWGLFQPDGASDSFTLENLTSVGSLTFAGSVVRADATSARVTYLEDHFFIHGGDGYFYIVNDVGTVTSSGAETWAGNPTLPQDGSRSFWDYTNGTEYSLETGALIRTITYSNWLTHSGAGRIYEPINDAIWVRAASGANIHILYLDRIGSSGVTLADVVNDVASWCGLSGAITSDLDQVVYGYSVTQGSGKDMIAPLLDIHDCIARPHDFSAEFIKRGDAPLGNLFTEDFVREGDEARYTVLIAQDTDLPRRVSLNYADIGHDQQTNTVESRRPLDAVDSVRELTLDLTTYVTDPDEAQRFTDRYLRRQWIRAEGHNLTLTAQELAIEPGDTWNLDLDGIVRTATCVKTVLSGGAIQTEWERDFPGLTTLGSGTGAPMDGRDDEVIYIPSPTKGFVLDIPLVEDSDNNANPILYYAAGKYITAASWPGAVIWQADADGDEFTDWNGVDSSQGATWGYALTALADANPWLWDRGNTVNVDVKGGTLASVTEAEIDADPTLNMAYLGGELLNFATATLEADGTYTLSGLKRGRRGTEWTTGDHAIGDEFVLAAYLLNDGIGLSEVGTTDSYKVATLGRDPLASPEIAFTVTGASLKPYAPARVKALSDGTDWTFTIIRRTRVGGAWVGGTTIPLSENSEEYEIEIYDGASVVRTLTLTGTNSVTWTNAMQVTDFGSTQTTKPDLVAYQLSDAVGRGFALAA